LRGYVLLETVVATGLLIVGLAVIGAQVQSADTSVRNMDRELRAMMLAEQQLAELDLGLIELESLDEVEEGDFGSRQPDWGWLMTTEPTVVESMFRVRIDIYYLQTDDDYQEDSFDYDEAERMFTAYAFRGAPRAIDFASDYGLSEEEFEELATKFADLGIPIDPGNFKPGTDFLDRSFEELVTILPLLMDAMGLDVDQLAAALPKDVLDQLREAGVFGDEDDGSGGNDSGDGERGNNNGGNDNNGEPQ
jgi:type II secretory pathway pseudopilin PulG